MLGTIVNVLAIILGSVIGLNLKKGMPARFKEVIMQGIGLTVILIGLKMSLNVNNEIIVIIALVLGGLLGEYLNIDYRLNQFGERLKSIIGSKDGGFVNGFVTASLIYCVGAMAIMGSIESGLNGNHQILFAKSSLDGISAIVFSSTLGIGVMFSALAVFIYQGILTLLAVAVKDFLTQDIITYMSCVGGLLIVGIGFNILGIKEFKVANLLPAVFIVIIVVYIGIYFFPQYV
ncbi:hypothetical protein SAMN00017405_1720 [Desulfonispora thiosulfatigenes DSM 11270]|uniref:Membrane protein YdfK n=1 Tax=Desulfonispora thiosulfatigenes DSM 11270 TaxID=656914 RepID=A0A1W1V2N9_DESTI|nr:DUF554 domain-containing protein [Desulfonispora thiosulfatigenes]SMB87568.1 hypothetical protein SAMN00017405_1720 [Desulfonispora thiosulfatigenes DSM 11270]